MEGERAFATDQAADPVIRTAHVSAHAPDAAQRLRDALGPGPFALALMFLSPEADLDTLAADIPASFPGATVVGCTTGGEISPKGYATGEIVAVALPAAHFASETLLIEHLDQLAPHEIVARLLRARQSLGATRPGWSQEFAFLMVDGLSIREDELTAVLAAGLGPVPLFGGSAGDGTRFGRTFVLHGGRMHQNAAVLSFLRSDCPIRVFNLDHVEPTGTRMVVTEADPARRSVRRINAEPAALEYARILGKDPGQLTSFTFAAHPVVVRLGGRHHVRSIREVAPNGELIFFSAIDEGLVLRLAEPQDMVKHLAGELARLAEPESPEAIVACDCILRRMEAEEKQMTGAISALFRRYHVVGFSTYGEQLGGMHVNQTMTGVAIYRPGP